MNTVLRKKLLPQMAKFWITSIEIGSPRRDEAESFIHDIFARRYGASVSSFAPRLLVLEQADRIVAAAGWRGADSGPLFLEHYLDRPIEVVMGQIIGRPVMRERIAEVGNLAADKPGSSLLIFSDLARRLDQSGHDWVVFTATRELLGMFARLGMPLLVLGLADPARLGPEAMAWGSYYESRPIVVAGRLRQGMDRLGRMGDPA